MKWPIGYMAPDLGVVHAHVHAHVLHMYMLCMCMLCMYVHVMSCVVAMGRIVYRTLMKLLCEHVCEACGQGYEKRVISHQFQLMETKLVRRLVTP